MAQNFVKKEITPEVISTFLDGHDPQERIVNFDYKYRDDKIKVYYRDKDDNRCVSEEPFYPFLWATRAACLKLKSNCEGGLSNLMKREGIGVKALDVTNSKGEVVEEILNGYTFMFYAMKPMSYSNFLNFFKAAGNPVYKDKSKSSTQQTQKEKRQYLVVTPIEQYMIATGKRMFKGYEDYDETLRMIFDLETTGLNTEADRIEQFGIRFNRPVKYKGQYKTFEKTYRVEGETEEEKDRSELSNIINVIKIIYTFKPDIITAHNGETFDWNMIIGACKRLGTTIEELSKEYFDGDVITKNKRQTVLKLGGEVETFNQTIVPGTVVTDSLHAVRRAQALDSNMLFSNLKYVTKYSKIVKPDRVYVPGDRISEIWNSTKRFMFNDEDGDWYIYDSEYVPQKVQPDKNMDLDYFQRILDEDRTMSATGNTKAMYSSEATAESLYNDYLESIKKENEKAPFRKGKADDKFTLYTKNFIMEGYREVTGKYIVNRYLLDDLWECDKVELRYNTTNFLICKILPVPFQKCCSMGTAGQWKALMMAWSYENNLAIPMFSDNKPFTGGLSRLLKVGYVPDVAKFDYNSLYPSIVLTWGIQPSKDLMVSMLSFLEHMLTQREKYKSLKKKWGNEKNRLKEELEKCKDNGKRKCLCDKIRDAAEKESLNDKKQIQTKVLCNSFFGSLGCPNIFPWGDLACAERTTCTGRQALRLMISHFSTLGEKTMKGSVPYADANPENFEAKDYDYAPIVGDSFTPDTPLFIKYDKNGLINIVSVRSMIDDTAIKIDVLGREYDYSEKSYKVLCRSGWMKPSYIYRHKTDKDIYEVSDENGMKVEVTEDHSLFNKDKVKIKPSEINESTELEYYSGDIIGGEGVCDVPLHIAEQWGKEMGLGLGSAVPMEILNSNKETMKAFYNSFMEHANLRKEFSKTLLAGLLYIRKIISK